MKVLMFSADPGLRDKNSEVGERMKKYAARLERLDIVLLDRARGRFFRFFKGYFEAKALLKRERFDVITAQEVEHSFLAWLLSRKFDVPWQMQIHTDVFSPYFGRHSMFAKIRVWLARFLIPKASCVRVVSERIKKSINRPDAVVLPIFTARKNSGGVDIKKKYPGYDFYILMVSRLTREKNIPLALETMRELVKKYPKMLLVIVGDGPEREKIELEIRNLKLEINAKLEGWQENLAGYYQTSDCLLLTSDYEGYGRAVVEALSYGLPVVMTDVGIAGEIVKNGENGEVVPVGDKNALVQALEKMYKHPLKPSPLKTQTEEEYLRLYIDNLKTCVKK